MNKQLRSDFQKFLATSGYCTPPGRAACALRSARILQYWRKVDGDYVRLITRHEEENYFDVYGKPDDEREYKALCEFIESPTFNALNL